ncbi:CopD family protein [Variovorax sp. UMC13]|uniref:CopD family protein n=1 Tax=Variovorax sp. UMC13 TaxID=1862326 RepID=UPI001602D7B7|nr:CopD family protein [Variovorax sp. UMC13]MBB1601459.1 hypothetical protein [Variovorax sp. UMC13]
MPWLKLLHVCAVIAWIGALLYLPAVIVAASRRGESDKEALPRHLLRGVFVNLATPAALVAIASGTAIFLWSGLLAHWLMVKLALVSLLVLGHASCAVLLLQAERGQPVARGFAPLLTLSSLLWLAAIAWLVLRKPF